MGNGVHGEDFRLGIRAEPDDYPERKDRIELLLVLLLWTFSSPFSSPSPLPIHYSFIHPTPTWILVCQGGLTNLCRRVEPGKKQSERLRSERSLFSLGEVLMSFLVLRLLLAASCEGEADILCKRKDLMKFRTAVSCWMLVAPRWNLLASISRSCLLKVVI